MNPAPKTHRYEELDALRGVASLMVVFFHFTWRRPEANLGFILGTTGVDLFFIISGFLICSIAAIVPAYFAARLDPVKALRFE